MHYYLIFSETNPLSSEEKIPDFQKDCFKQVHPGLHKSILSNMRKLSFRSTETFSGSHKSSKTSDSSQSDHSKDSASATKESEEQKMLKMMQIGDTQHHFTRNGHLVANKQLIYKIDKEKGVQSVTNMKLSQYIIKVLYKFIFN